MEKNQKQQMQQPVEWQQTRWICGNHSKYGCWETRKGKREGLWNTENVFETNRR